MLGLCGKWSDKYQLHLPTEQQLLAEVRKEWERFNTDEIE